MPFVHMLLQSSGRESSSLHPDGELTPFGDTIAELSKWYAFCEKPSPKGTLWLSPQSYYVPARNPFRDVGRNDPCPCGSGNKFKKCCLASGTEALLQRLTS